MSTFITLNEFIMQRQVDFPYASGELSRLLAAIGSAAKIINYKVNRAGLQDILGSAGSANVQGEVQQKLDVVANQVFMNHLQSSGLVAGIASEEMEDCVAFNDTASRQAGYVVLFDPLDGSGNVDVNVSIGTIFSIYRRLSAPGTPAEERDFLQKGTEQVAAGYVIYGSSTMLVYTTGRGVNGFTLEPGMGEFCLSHPDMKLPAQGTIYSMNEGNLNQCEEGLQAYIKWCRESDKSTGRPYSARYIGSLVADFHRNLIKGGIYIYPATRTAPAGKLRLLYECNPLALVAEQAGGKATNGSERILELSPHALHQRCPLYIGSTHMVAQAVQMLTARTEKHVP